MDCTVVVDPVFFLVTCACLAALVSAASLLCAFVSLRLALASRGTRAIANWFLAAAFTAIATVAALFFVAMLDALHVQPQPPAQKHEVPR